MVGWDVGGNAGIAPPPLLRLVPPAHRAASPFLPPASPPLGRARGAAAF